MLKNWHALVISRYGSRENMNAWSGGRNSLGCDLTRGITGLATVLMKSKRKSLNEGEVEESENVSGCRMQERIVGQTELNPTRASTECCCVNRLPARMKNSCINSLEK